MELRDVLDVYVEYVVALYGEYGVFDVIIFHVYSCGVCASVIIYVWLVLYVYARCDVVSC